MSDLGVRRPGPALLSNERSTPETDNTGHANTATSPAHTPPPHATSDHIETTGTDTHRTPPGTTTNVERVAAGLLSVQGSLSSPRVILDSSSAIGQVQHGSVEVRIPLNAGHKIGPTTVREDTWVNVQLAVQDGKIDRKNTRILFENSDGERTDLDGPFIWDAEQIYIDEDGQLKADVPCFPDPNITEKVLGQEKVPENIEDFVALLAQQGQMPKAQNLIEPLSVSNLVNGKPSASPQGVSNSEPVSPGPATSSNHTAANTPAPAINANNPLDGVLRFPEAQISFSGTLKTGPMSFGDGLDLHIAPNTQIQGNGSFSDLDVTLNGNISHMEMQAQNSLLKTGQGSIRVDAKINSARHDDGTLDRSSPKIIDCAISELQAENIYLETPGIHRRHRLKLNSFELRSDDNQAPIARFTRDYAKSHPDMAINFPDVDMRGLSADVEVTGADGNPANFLIGDIDGNQNTQNVDLSGSIRFESTSGDFDFQATTQGLNARLISADNTSEDGAVELIDGKHFNLSLNEAFITGAGAISLHSASGVSALHLDANDDNPWTFQIDVDDATFKGDPERTNLIVDLSTETHGILRLDTFNLHEGQKPQFDGNAEFAVTLDALNFKAEDIPGLELKPGTQGTLKVHNMTWCEGNPSPAIDATLELNLGADALLDIGNIPGLEGARVNIDAETGQTSLLMDIQLLADGTVNSQVDINLQGLFLRTDFERGDGDVDTLPEITLPTTPIPETGSMELLRIEDNALLPGPQNLSGTALSTSYVPTNLPNFAIQPMDIFTELERAQINMTCPLNRTRFNVTNVDNTYLKDLGLLGTDRVGFKARVNLDVSNGQMHTALHVVNGKIAPNVSRLNINPPLEIDIDVTAYGYGPLSTSAEVVASVSSLVIRKDSATGKGYLEPIYELEMSGALGIADIIDYFDDDDSFIKDLLHDKVNDELTAAIFGTKTIPLDEAELMTLLGAQIPDLSDPIEINSQELVGDSLPSRNTTPNTHSSDNRTNTNSTSTTSNSSVRTTNNPSTNLSQIVDLTSAQLTVKNTELKPTTLNLGDGQFISFAQDSQLSLSGDLNNFTIEGRANISSLQLGKDELGITLGESSIDVKIKVSAGRGGAAPNIELELTNITTSDLNLHGQVPSGNIDIKNATVQNASLVLQTGGGEDETFRLKLPEIEGDFTGIVAPPVLDSHDTQTLIAVHSAHIKGNLELDSTGSVNIENSIFSDLSASIVSPPVLDKSLAGDIENANYNLNFQQVDISGSALINVQDQSWSINSTTSGEATMKGRAIANDVAFRIVGPEMALDLAPQAEIEMALENFSVDNANNVTFSAHDFQVLGTLDAGHITTSAPASDQDDASIVPKKIAIAPGTRVAIDLDYFSANFDNINESLLTSGTLRLEGSVLEPGNINELKHHSELGKLHLSSATYDQSDFKMIVALETDGVGNIAATSKTSIDLDAHLEFEGRMNSEEINNMIENIEENE